MITEWEPPMEWSNCSPVSDEETNVKLTSTTFGEGSEGTPPPTILLRATREISGDAEKCHALDTDRILRHLGWEQYNQGFIQAVYDIPGHHFSVFDWDNVSSH